MKESSLAKFAMIIIFPILFFACAGDSSINAEADEASKKETLQKEIVGRWLFSGENLRVLAGENSSLEFLAGGTYILVRDSGQMTTNEYVINSSSEISLKDFGTIRDISIEKETASFKLLYQNKELSVGARKSDDPVSVDPKKYIIGKWLFTLAGYKDKQESSFVEFLENGTYVFFTSSGFELMDKYIIPNETEVVLNGLGEMKNIEFSQGNLSFKLTYNKKEASIVNAKKSDVLKDDERTRLLSRNWNMTPVKNGKDSLRASIKKSTVLFTRNGTYLVQAFGESNKNPITSLYNWQWHSKDPEKFVIWKEWDKINEDRNSTIQKLSETTLWIGGTTFGYEFEAIK